MIISPKYKFTFLKNPKTGGTTIHNVLPVFLERNSTIPNQIETVEISNSFFGKQTIKNYSPYYNLKNYINKGLIPGNISEYCNYLIVRDPVDRFQSLCRHVRDNGWQTRVLFKERLEAVSTDNDKKQQLLPFSRRLSLSDFSPEYIKVYKSITLEEIGNKILETPLNSQVPNFDFLRIPQNYYYEDDNITPIDFNKLEENYHKICDRHGIPKVEKFLKYNEGTRKTSDSFSTDLINRVKNVYAEDVEFYSILTKG